MENYNYDIEPLRKDMKLLLPEVSGGRMLCVRHGLLCYRGRVEGEFVCPSEQHVGSIWISKYIRVR